MDVNTPSALDVLVNASNPVLRPLEDIALSGEDAAVRADAAQEIARLQALLGDTERSARLARVTEGPRAELRGRRNRVAHLQMALSGALGYLADSCEFLKDEELTNRLRWCATRLLSHDVSLRLAGEVLERRRRT